MYKTKSKILNFIYGKQNFFLLHVSFLNENFKSNRIYRIIIPNQGAFLKNVYKYPLKQNKNNFHEIEHSAII